MDRYDKALVKMGVSLKKNRYYGVSVGGGGGRGAILLERVGPVCRRVARSSLRP